MRLGVEVGVSKGEEKGKGRGGARRERSEPIVLLLTVMSE